MAFLEEVLRSKDLKEEREILKGKDFVGAISKRGINIIAEVKRVSPSLGKLFFGDAVSLAKGYERSGACAVSVITERFHFGGSLEDLKRVSLNVSIPVLMKDFVLYEEQVRVAKLLGASAVLLIARVLGREKLKGLLELCNRLEITPLVEVFNYEEGLRAIELGAKVIGINNRDLNTLKVNWKRSRELIPKLKEHCRDCLFIAESGIESKEQIEELKKVGARAFLVGTSLLKSENPFKKLQELLGEGSR